MKKILILSASIATISCQNNVPKCNDPKVFEIIHSIINENKNQILFENGAQVIRDEDTISSNNTQIVDIITTKKDDELNSCGCEGTLIYESKYKDIFMYKLFQKDSNGNNVPNENYDKEITSINEGSIIYSAQKNSDDEIIVKVESIGPLKTKEEL